MWLRVYTGEDAGREVALAAERPCVLGRERGSDLVVRDPRVSRRHAELRPLAGGRFLLRDLDSTNGTWVGGDRVAEAVLVAGAELRLGDVRLALAAEPLTPPKPAARPHSSRPTYSMIGRLVDSRARRTHRTVGAIAGLVGAIAVAAVAVVTLGGDADAAGDRVPTVVAELAPSTVLVESLKDGARVRTGSGWVLSARDGLVVTNAHVLLGQDVRVAAAGRRRAARVVGVAPCEDVALLRVSDAGGLRSATLGQGASVRQGETVVALGYPDGAGPEDALTSTTGVVSVARTIYDGGAADVPAYTEAVQTDTALNPGNSGGPLADLRGRMVGMSAAVRTTDADGRPVQNQGYAIAADRLRTVTRGLRTGRSPAWTGLTFAYPTAQDLAARRLPAGLVATGAVAGSPAARAGLGDGAPGEVLVAVDGRRVGSTLTGYCAAFATGAGPAVPRTLTFARAGSGRLRRVVLR